MFIRELTGPPRQGGAHPEANARLRLAIDTARSANMPQENIERAIQKGTGELAGVAYEEIAYEGYAAGGVALYLETTTDNQNRTVAELRKLLDRHGGNLGTPGSVAWQFQKRGQIYVEAARYPEDRVLEVALEAGAEDVRFGEGEHVITTDVASFHGVQWALRSAEITVTLAELVMLPLNEISVGGADAERLLKLLDALDDHDDVQRVSSNANLDEALMAAEGA